MCVVGDTTGRVIAPKKAAVIAAQRTHKVWFVCCSHTQTLEKAIKANIEQEIAGRAKANAQNLKIVKIATAEPDAKGKGAKRKTTGQIIKETKKKLA